MRITLKLVNCRVSMTYFVKNNEIFINYCSMKNSHGNIAFLPIVKLVTHTL